MLLYSLLQSFVIHSPSSIDKVSYNTYKYHNDQMVGEHRYNYMSRYDSKHNSFKLYHTSEEYDLRMTYCAFSICSMLDDWSCINRHTAVAFIRSCRVGFLNQAPKRAQMRPWPEPLFLFFRHTKEDTDKSLIMKHMVGVPIAL